MSMIFIDHLCSCKMLDVMRKILLVLFLLAMVTRWTCVFAQGPEFITDLGNIHSFDISNSSHYLMTSTGETYIVTRTLNTACAGGTVTSSKNAIVITKLNASKVCSWTVTSSDNTSFSAINEITDAVVDNAGNLIVAGVYSQQTSGTTLTLGTASVSEPATTGGGSVNFLAKINNNGTVAWLRSFYLQNQVNTAGSSYSYYSCTDVCLAVDASNNIYLGFDGSSIRGLIYQGTMRSLQTSGGIDGVFKVLSTGGYSTGIFSNGSITGSGIANYKLAFNNNNLVVFCYASNSSTGGFQLGSCPVVSSGAACSGLYVVSLSTSLAFVSHAFYKSAGGNDFIGIPLKVISLGADSVIVAYSASNSIPCIWGTYSLKNSYSGSETLCMAKLKTSALSTVFWAKEYSINDQNGTYNMFQKGIGNLVYVGHHDLYSIDLGGGISLPSGSSPGIISCFNASDGSPNWAVNYKSSTIAFNPSDSRLHFLLMNNTLLGTARTEAIYRIDTRLKITSVTASATLCWGSAFSVNFSYAQTPSAGNIYSVEMSNENGNFDNATVVGTLSSTALSGTVSCTFPTGLEGGNGYLLRIKASNPTSYSIHFNTPLNVGTPKLGNVSNTLIENSMVNQCEQLNLTINSKNSNSTSLQWALNTGSGFSNISDNATYSGTNGAVLTVNTIPLSYNSYQYRLTSSNSACPSSVATQTFTVTVKPRPTVASVTPGQRCNTGTVTISATPGTGATIQWYAALTGGSFLASTSSYTTPSISTSTTYYADAYLNGCYALSRTSVLASVITTPSISSTTPGSRCGVGSVNISATSTTGTVTWYTAATGGTTLGTGSPFATPSISATTTFYADASLSGCTTATRTAVVATYYVMPTISSKTDGARCDAGTVAMSAVASTGNVLWYTAATGGSLVNTGPTYSVTLSTTTTYYLDAATATCTTATRTSVVGQVTPTPTISSVGNGARCDAGTVDISGTPTGGTINWYNFPSGGSILYTGTTYTTPVISSTTTYYAEPVNNGCIGSSRTAVIATVNTTPLVNSVTDGSRCGTGSVNLGATQSAGQLDWYSSLTGGSKLGTGTSFSSPTISTTTNYYVEATTSTCTTATRRQAVATVKTIPSIASFTNSSRCDPGTVTLSATSSPGSAVIYWYSVSAGGSSIANGNAFITPSISVTTTYYIEATENGCTTATRSSVVATIASTPTISSITPGIRCDAGTVLLGATASAGTVNWYTSPSGGSSIGSGTSFTTPPIASTTTYYAEAVVSGCTSTSRASVGATVNTTPGISGVTNGTRCGDGSLTLSAIPSAGILNWYTAATGGTSIATTNAYITPSLTNTTVYYVEATNNGCTTNPRIAVTATINTLPAYTLSSSNPASCNTPTGSFTLSGLSPSSNYILKYNGNSGSSVSSDAGGAFSQTGLLAGSYTSIFVTDINNCQSNVQSVTLADPGGPSVDAGPVQLVCRGDQVKLKATYSLSDSIWWNTGENIDSVLFTATGIGKTIYAVNVKKSGCVSSDTVSVMVGTSQSIVGYGAIPTKDVTSPPFTLASTSTSGLPVSYVSLTPSIATVSGNTVTIVGPGTASIKAVQAGNNCINPAKDSVQSFLVTGKLNQFITFGSMSDITFGDAPITSAAYSSSGLQVNYAVSDSTVIKVVNGSLIALKAGIVTVKAFASGSSMYNPSDTVSQLVRVIIPPFTIFGKNIVTDNNVENYFISPNTASKYTFSWNYKGSNIYYASDTVSNNVGVFFSNKATNNYLRCRVYSIASGSYYDVQLFITINHQTDAGQPATINCDSLKGTFTICSGKYINGFKLEAAQGDIISSNTGCNQGYADYTKAGLPYTGELYLGESYSAEIKIRNQSSTDASANYIGVWIDYNNNGSFDDQYEFLLSTYTNDSIVILKNILINANTEYLGPKRLRIKVRSSGLFSYDESCYDYNESGETEDYKITLIETDKLEAPVLLTPNEDGKNDLFIIRGIYSKPDASENKLIIMDRMGNILFTEVNYKNEWSGKSSEDKLLPRDTYYYNFVNGDGTVIRGYFEIRY